MDISSEKNKEFVFQQTYLKALLDNKNNALQWLSYKEKYEEVVKSLQFYNDKSKHAVCIPVGKKAFVKGNLVHTNDVWVTLGCGYFLKTSARAAIEICERRIKEVEELIKKCDAEKKLLQSMKEYSEMKETFGGEGTKDIVERFDEEEEQKWREEHREREKKYRQQLKEIKNKTQSPNLKDEKDLWEHLEALELQEELEDELNRLGCNEASSEDNDSADEDNTSEESSESDGPDNYEQQQETSEAPKVRKSVTFAEVIEFEDGSNINKKKLITELPEVNDKKKLITELPNVNYKNLTTEPPSAVLDEVIEKVSSVNNTMDSEYKRPTSKFKLNRNK